MDPNPPSLPIEIAPPSIPSRPPRDADHSTAKADRNTVPEVLHSPHPAFQAALEILRNETNVAPQIPDPGPRLHVGLPRPGFGPSLPFANIARAHPGPDAQ